MQDYMTCPQCAGDIPLAEDTVQGELVECPNCGREVEVISLKPFPLDPSPREQDWGEVIYSPAA